MDSRVLDIGMKIMPGALKNPLKKWYQWEAEKLTDELNQIKNSAELPLWNTKATTLLVFSEISIMNDKHGTFKSIRDCE